MAQTHDADKELCSIKFELIDFRLIYYTLCCQLSYTTLLYFVSSPPFNPDQCTWRGNQYCKRSIGGASGTPSSSPTNKQAPHSPIHYEVGWPKPPRIQVSVPSLIINNFAWYSAIKLAYIRISSFLTTGRKNIPELHFRYFLPPHF